MEQPGTGHDPVASGQTHPREHPDQAVGGDRSAVADGDQDGELPGIEDGDEIVPL